MCVCAHAPRQTGDAVPHDWFERSLWHQLGDNSLLAAALGVRPMLDVLWTTPTQPGDPRWAGDTRRNVRHDLTMAVLSTGPIGFGDLLGDTDAVLLGRAMRADGAARAHAESLLLLHAYPFALRLSSITP